MKAIVPIAAALLAGGCAMGEPVERSGEARLAADLDMRMRGEPQTCVALRRLGGNRAFGEGGILFEGTGHTVYVNRPPGGCPSLRFGRALRVRTTGAQLCAGEIVSVFDPVSGTEFGGCALGEFVPYHRTP